MKIAIPAGDKNIESKVNPTFGRTEYFAIVDDETMEYEFFVNSAASSQGGAGIKAAEAIVKEGIGAVITYRLGENAASVLLSADVKIIKAVDGSILEVVNKYKNGELSLLDSIHPGYHNHGGK